MNKKETGIVSNKNKNDIARLEPMYSVNNSYFALAKKQEPNNNSIKIGTSLNQVDLSKVDPTKSKQMNTVSTLSAAAHAFRKWEWDTLLPQRHQRQDLH